MNQDGTAEKPFRRSVTTAPYYTPLLVGGLVGLLFFLVADHFLSPPDCAFYWAWAETLTRFGNLDFGPVYERLHMPTLYVWLTPAGHLSNDWPMGAGLLLLPTVLLGRALAHAWMVLWVVGALALWWRTAPFGGSARLLGLVSAVVGTPLLFYTAFGPFFSHPASFAAVTAFLITWERTRLHRSRHEWVLLGLLLGFSALVRPQNALLVLVLLFELPAIWRSRRVATPLALFGGAAVLGFAPQMLAWWSLYGSPLAIPKAEEMRWLAPNVRELLLSDFHGVLPWTPVYALAAVGLIVLGLRDKTLAAGLALLLASQVYLNAANLVWWSGGSFGNRRLADYSIIVAYALAALWDVRPGSPPRNGSVPPAPSRVFRAGIALAAAACCLWTLLLLLAERRGLLPLDRYVPFRDPSFRSNLVRVLTEPLETGHSLTRALWQAWDSPTAGSDGSIVPRLVATGIVGLGVAGLTVLVRRLRRYHLAKMALPLVVVAGLLAAAIAIAGLRTPKLRDPQILSIVRKTPGILWDNYIELALYEITQGQPDRAEVAARRAIAIRPDHYSNYWYLAAALRQQGRYDEAISAYDQLLQLHPEHPLAGREREAVRALLYTWRSQ